MAVGADGAFAAGPELIFRVLPALFATMGAAGDWVAVAFFALLAIAALTSSISMLEVPTSLLAERLALGRPVAAALAAAVGFALTALLAARFEALFECVVSLATTYAEPLLGVALCLFAGWCIHRDRLLGELARAEPTFAESLFWRLWQPWVRLACPLLIGAGVRQLAALRIPAPRKRARPHSVNCASRNSIWSPRMRRELMSARYSAWLGR
ncbi:MAG: hypothetical protein KatS3mg124_2048 [Porticoccaceae bacterium]|nr:MAG: hypothetical protein KatS3mg124_2048 [Porticoccaceae bacterium]